MKRNSREGLLFAAPYFTFFTCFFIIPLVFGILISFTNWGLLDSKPEFVGLENYKTLLFDTTGYAHTEFFNALGNTVAFAIIFVPLVIITSLALAVFVLKIPGRLQGFFRSIYFLPFAISVASVGVMWKWVFNTNSGVLNQILEAFGFEQIAWLVEQPFASATIIFATLWWTVGFCMIIFISAMNDIPDEIYEAADIDGSGPWRKFRKITLPHIQPALTFLIITQTIGSLNLYGQASLMTNGGPDSSTETVIMVIYNQAFEMKELGMASAMAIVFALIIMVISGILLFIVNRIRRY